MACGGCACTSSLGLIGTCTYTSAQIVLKMPRDPKTKNRVDALTMVSNIKLSRAFSVAKNHHTGSRLVSSSGSTSKAQTHIGGELHSAVGRASAKEFPAGGQ